MIVFLSEGEEIRIEGQEEDMSICPRCLGTGNVIESETATTIGYIFPGRPCDYPGCHNGHIQEDEGDADRTLEQGEASGEKQ